MSLGSPNRMRCPGSPILTAYGNELGEHVDTLQRRAAYSKIRSATVSPLPLSARRAERQCRSVLPGILAPFLDFWSLWRVAAELAMRAILKYVRGQPEPLLWNYD